MRIWAICRLYPHPVADLSLYRTLAAGIPPGLSKPQRAPPSPCRSAASAGSAGSGRGGNRAGRWSRARPAREHRASARRSNRSRSSASSSSGGPCGSSGWRSGRASRSSGTSRFGVGGILRPAGITIAPAGPPRRPPNRKQRESGPPEDHRKTRVRGRHPRILGPAREEEIRESRRLQSWYRCPTHRTDRLSASPPLFESRFLDFFSRVHPAIPALIFVPVVLVCAWLGLDRGYNVLQVAGLIALGLLIWTLTEYWLHRLVFHWEPDHPLGSRLHFIMHGVHHDHPNDRLRLVMPPAVSIPLAVLFFFLFDLIFGTPAVYPLFAGFIVGLSHLRLHPLPPSPSRADDRRRQAAARAAHAAPLPGPPVRIRRLLATLGLRVPDPLGTSQAALNTPRITYGGVCNYTYRLPLCEIHVQ